MTKSNWYLQPIYEYMHVQKSATLQCRTIILVIHYLALLCKGPRVVPEHRASLLMAAAVSLCSTGASHCLIAIALCISILHWVSHIWIREPISHLCSILFCISVSHLLFCLGKVVCLSARRRLWKHSFCIHRSLCHLAVYHHGTGLEPVW